MRGFIFGAFAAVTLIAGISHATGYRLTRVRNLTTVQINNLFQIAVDRGVWPGAATDIRLLCGERTANGGKLIVRGLRDGSDLQMVSDRVTHEDDVELLRAGETQ